MTELFLNLLDKVIDSRVPLFDSSYESALRLFNGFTEGYPDLVIDIYGRTLVIHNYAKDPEQNEELINEVKNHIQNALEWLHAGILKTRNGKTLEEKRGILLFGTDIDRKIKEHGVWYAIDLTINQDTSLYLDTRDLRKWLIENLKNRSVLNTFAYTGSFGVAALAGGASRVVQIDLNREFLNLAKTSYSLNGFPIQKGNFIARDFFEQVGNLKRENKFFDCVIIDPPFFSTTSKGKVDQEKESARLINKVRPLINDGGYLVAINNALYVSGQDYMQTLESLCKDGYLRIKELIPVPEDFTGYPALSTEILQGGERGYLETRMGNPITDPSPFNHSTKIAIMEVKKKQVIHEA